MEINGSWCLITPNRAKNQESIIKTKQTAKYKNQEPRNKTIQNSQYSPTEKWGMVYNNPLGNDN